MKVRIGVGISGSQLTLPQMVRLVDDLEGLGFDSLWLSEVLTAPVIDPLVGLSWAAGRNQKIKLGTTMLLPGRNPVRLAKELNSQVIQVLDAGEVHVWLRRVVIEDRARARGAGNQAQVVQLPGHAVDDQRIADRWVAGIDGRPGTAGRFRIHPLLRSPLHVP